MKYTMPIGMRVLFWPVVKQSQRRSDFKKVRGREYGFEAR